jgi:molecular chaperone GrpE
MDNNETVDYSEVEENKKEKKKEKKMSKEEKKICELEEQVATLNEKYLYALAQMKDLHKTYEKENAISVKYVTHDLMLELLPIIDVFSMVLDNPNIPNEVSAYFKGFELVFNQFKDLMERHQVSEINCKVNDEFDHNIHNGVEKIETENKEDDNRICQILQKGYKIGDKVLRPVSVKVYSYASKEVKENIEQEDNLEAKSENSEEDKGE